MLPFSEKLKNFIVFGTQPSKIEIAIKIATNKELSKYLRLMACKYVEIVLNSNHTHVNGESLLGLIPLIEEAEEMGIQRLRPIHSVALNIVKFLLLKGKEYQEIADQILPKVEWAKGTLKIDSKPSLQS